MILSKFASRFIKNQEAKGILSNLRIKAPLSKVPTLRDVLFWMQANWACTYKNE